MILISVNLLSLVFQILLFNFGAFLGARKELNYRDKRKATNKQDTV